MIHGARSLLIVVALCLIASAYADANNPVRDEFELRSAVLEFDW